MIVYKYKIILQAWIYFFTFREEWMTAIKGVSERLSDVDEVEMEGVSHSTSMSSTMSGPSSDDFSAKFSVQGTSSSKSTGKRKVVCIIRIEQYKCIL